jgi:hypothetical protein
MGLVRGSHSDALVSSCTKQSRNTSTLTTIIPVLRPQGSVREPSCHLRQRRFGLGQPEGHVHGAVQRDSGREGGAGLLTTAGLAV